MGTTSKIGYKAFHKYKFNGVSYERYDDAKKAVIEKHKGKEITFILVAAFGIGYSCYENFGTKDEKEIDIINF